MFSLSERRWRGSLITGYKYHCGEENTRSLISRRKACQAKWFLALSQTNTNEKPRHRDSHFPSAVLVIPGQAGWWAQQGDVSWGERRRQCKDREDFSRCPLTAGAAAPEHASSHPPLKGAYTSVERKRRKQK